MSQHSQRTQLGPSRTSIVIGAALVLASALTTGYMISGLEPKLRDLMGFALGVGFTGLLAYHVLVMVAERAVVRERVERETQRAVAQEREESAGRDELTAWQNAAAGLLDAYLTGRAVDFHGEVVPDYVRTRLADLAYEPVSPPVYPSPGPDETRTWLADPEVAARYEDPVAREVDRAVTGYLDEELDPNGYPLGYQADPARPWNAFEPSNASVAVPLPPRQAEPFRPQPTYPASVPVSPGRRDLEGEPPDVLTRPGWTGSDTEVLTRPGSGWHGDETEVISRVRDEDATEVIERVRQS